MNSPVRLGVSSSTQPPQVFTARDFEALFPGTGSLAVCLAPQLFFLVIYMQMLECPVSSLCLTCPSPPAAACHQSSPPQLLISAPPTILGECFFFNSLVLGLPYSSIFCQFWLFLFLKLLSFFWLWEESQCVCLCLHLGWKSQLEFLSSIFKGILWLNFYPFFMLQRNSSLNEELFDGANFILVLF